MNIDDKRSVLRNRAKRLSRRHLSKTAPINELEVLEFFLSGERYGIQTSNIKEICQCGSIIKVPCTPPFVKGVFSRRGRLISVIDLRAIFGLPSRLPEGRNMLILLTSHEMEFAILADSIGAIIYLKEDAINPEIPSLVSFPEGYVKGITADRMIILNHSALLEDKKLIVCDVVD